MAGRFRARNSRFAVIGCAAAILIIPNMANADDSWIGDFPRPLVSFASYFQGKNGAPKKKPAEQAPRGDQPPPADSTPSGITRFPDIEDEPVETLDRRQPVRLFTRQPPSAPATPTATVGRTPAAVFVVTPEMIRRSGARTLPELLRMVPGLYVARIDASKWTVSARGFSTRFSRKLLTQIDGRTIYTSIFGGTFWDVKDVLLKDVERIEVIRGPGATLWGANAVNGIINIVTKSAAKTHGTYVEAGGGTEERGFAGARYGGVTDGGINYRVYSKWSERDAQFHPMGRAHDDWRQGRVGFRSDWEPEAGDSITTIGELYVGRNGIANNQPLIGLGVDDEPVSGGHLLGRWTREIDDDRDMTLQIYYDRTNRKSLGFDQNVNVLDVDFQYRMRPVEKHQVIWGLGYRRSWDRLVNSRVPAFLAMSPTKRTIERTSAFVQDEIKLVEDKLFFTAGSKFSNNTFTDFEVQPSARLLWLPDRCSSAWASVSRAVRIPSRAAHDARLIIGDVGGVIPISLRGGGGDLVAEDTMAYEIGYRRQETDWFSWDLATFFNVDRNIITFRPAPGPTTLQFYNGANTNSYGVELAAQLKLTEDWRLFGWYTFFRLLAEFPAPSVVPPAFEEGDPKHQVFLMSSWDLTENLQLDLMSRYVDNNSAVNVRHYISMDLRLAWRPKKNLELSVVGQNLLDSHHPEYGSSLFVREVSTEVQRGVYGMVSYEY